MAQVTFARDGAVAVITMTPPEEFMTRHTVAELAQAVDEAATDDAVRALVLTGGNDGVFIRHYDVKEIEHWIRRYREMGTVVDLDMPTARDQTLDTLYDGLAEMAKPSIAAINGTAMGGGFELALACDLRIAQAGDFALGLPEINLGILPGAGGTQRLSRLIGAARALELILRGRTVAPDEALSLGMVHEVADGNPLARALEIAQEIAAKPARAAAHIKHLVRQLSREPLPHALAMERTYMMDLLTSDEALDFCARMNAEGLDIREI